MSKKNLKFQNFDSFFFETAVSTIIYIYYEQQSMILQSQLAIWRSTIHEFWIGLIQIINTHTYVLLYKYSNTNWSCILNYVINNSFVKEKFEILETIRLMQNFLHRKLSQNNINLFCKLLEITLIIFNTGLNSWFQLGHFLSQQLTIVFRINLWIWEDWRFIHYSKFKLHFLFIDE